MDILGLHLSPRKKGNSADMLAEFSRGANEAGAETGCFSVAEHNIKPCMDCGACEKTGNCVITDDDMKPLYPILATVPKVVVSTPVFFYEVPAQGKALIDRTQPLWSRRYALNKTETLRPDGRGFLLALGATKGQDLFVGLSLCLKYFFDSIGLPKDFDSLCFRQIEASGELARHPDYLELIFEAGKAFGARRS